MDKQKFKQKIKDVKNDTVYNLQPVVKQSASDLLEVLKTFVDDVITEIFEKNKKRRKNERNDIIEKQEKTRSQK